MLLQTPCLNPVVFIGRCSRLLFSIYYRLVGFLRERRFKESCNLNITEIASYIYIRMMLNLEFWESTQHDKQLAFRKQSNAKWTALIIVSIFVHSFKKLLHIQFSFGFSILGCRCSFEWCGPAATDAHSVWQGLHEGMSPLSWCLHPDGSPAGLLQGGSGRAWGTWESQGKMYPKFIASAQEENLKLPINGVLTVGLQAWSVCGVISHIWYYSCKDIQ